MRVIAMMLLLSLFLCGCETPPAAPQSTPVAAQTPAPLNHDSVPQAPPAPEIPLTPMVDGARDFDADGFVFPHSSDTQLTAADFSELASRPGGLPYFTLLRYARNEIYARKGHIFSDPELKAHYEGRAWYAPIEAEAQLSSEQQNKKVQLSSIEQQNVSLIAAVEKARSGTAVDIPTDELPGLGEALPEPGAVYAFILQSSGYVFYDAQTDTLTPPKMLQPLYRGTKIAAFFQGRLTEDGEVETALFGLGGKQLTDFGGCEYYIGEQGGIFRAEWDDNARIALLSPPAYGEVLVARMGGGVYPNITELLDGRYILRDAGRIRMADARGQTVAALEEARAYSYYFPIGGEAPPLISLCNTNGLWGAVDMDAKPVIPFIYATINDFSEGMVAAQLPDDTWVCLDTKGNTLFTAPASTSSLGEMSGGVAIITGPDGKGVVDKAGRTVLSPTYEDVQIPRGFPILIAREDGWYTYYTPDGQHIETLDGCDLLEYTDGAALFTNRKTLAVSVFGEDYMPVPVPGNVTVTGLLPGPYLLYQEEGKSGAGGGEPTGLMDMDGNIILPPAYEFIYECGKDKLIASVRRYGKLYYGLFDVEGRTLLNAEYLSITPRRDLFEVWGRDVTGLMDAGGRFIAAVPRAQYLDD